MERLAGSDPRQVGPYTLVGRLGAGGMGAVYLGRSSGGRTVAVKVVRPDLAGDDGFRDRFRREVAAARLVSGAFTAPVVDADPDAGVPWMATAFVPGVPLSRAVTAHGPLPEAALRMLTAGLAEALVGVHAAGVVHRDLKPANVLLALDGPHVIDFGIARATDGTTLTSTGSVIGSAPYMSPEQALGQHLTPASDVFSLGTTVAFAALGESPFGDGAGAAVLFRVVHTEPDLSAVPESLRPLVERCLAKDPEERPAPREVIAAVAGADPGAPSDPRLALLAGARPGGAPVDMPRLSDGWLPEPVAADVLALRAALAAELPPAAEPAATDPYSSRPSSSDPYSSGPSGPESGPAGSEPPGTAPTRPLSGPPPADAPPAGPNGRRRLLLGLAAGAVAAAAGTTWALARGDGSADEGSGGAGGSAKGGGGTASPRPSADAVPDAKLAWQARLPASVAQVLPGGGIVACVMLETVVGLDRRGRTAWTVKVGDHDLLPSVAGPNVQTLAAVDGDRLYVSGSRFALSGSRAGVLSVRMTDGKDARVTLLDDPPAIGVLSFPGVRGGRAFLSPMLQAGSGTTSTAVWALDLAGRRTAWVHTPEALPVFWGLPQSGGGLLYADTQQLVALDAGGKTAWTKETAAVLVGAAGRYFLAADKQGTLSALDPADGRAVWKVPKVVPASARGGGCATDEKGETVFVLLQDGDGGLSLAALGAADGKARWRTPLPVEPEGGSLGGVGARLLYADGNVYRMGADGTLWAFSAASGAARWKYGGFKGSDLLKIAWSAGDRRLCVSDVAATTVAALDANGA
ncbi:protein kinase domain-containing protein [Streptomyces cinereoruber]|uniref:protein kinase domain-containing protein n=1 Tax=Streptomyces cinereoruber TaxID=67260 RepID=UPI0036569CC5